MEKKQIVFFGLGLMGYPMAEHIAKAGFPTYIWNRTEQKAENLLSTNKEFTNNLYIIKDIQQTLKNPDISYIISMLFDYKAIVQTIFDNVTTNNELSLKGKTIIQMSTVSVDENKDLKERTEKLGGQFIEAPVLGTNTVAQAAKLQVFLGCSKELYEKVKEDQFLQTLGSLRYIGNDFKATKMKLTMNLLVGSLTTVLANAVGLIESNDLDMDVFTEILRNSAFYFKYVDVKLPRMVQRDYQDQNFSVSGMLKDVDAIEKLAKESNVYTGVIHSIKELCEKTVEQSKTKGEQEDMSSVYEVMNPKQQK
ncbi:hypothetical protein ABK040_003782 [Willaertia magna]